MSTVLRHARLALLGALVVAFCLALALPSTGMAAPSDPVMSVAKLQSLLASSPGGLPARFMTVDKGSTIETLTANILAVTGGESSDSALILFEATDAKVDKFGGIVAGMSGSPLYVQDDDSVWKVAGAVSYGDYFTLGGTGLATPIESMVAIRDAYKPLTAHLDTPVVTTDGLVKDIVVSPTPQKYAAAAAAGTFVAAPLSTTFIGGLDPNSTGYKLLAKDLAAHGHSVVPLAAPLGSAPKVGDQSFTTPLVPGAAVAALESRGDMWLGGVGTVTYTDDNDILAFGHSAFGMGATSLYMSNAWIDGVWRSSMEPYKLARVGALRGTITQDRGAGILGSVGDMPAETTFTASVTDDDASKVATSAVYMPRALVNSATIDPITAAMALYVAGERVENADYTPGSAEVTTTVVASDGTHTYTIAIPNVLDDGGDITLAIEQDAATAINELQMVPTDGVHKMQLLSVDLTAHFTRDRRWARIVGIKTPQGLKSGANEVDVLVREYGQEGTQTIPTTLTIPAGVSTTGYLYAESQSYLRAYGSEYGSGSYYSVSTGNSEGIAIYIPSAPGFKSVADVAQGLSAKLPDNVVTVEYYPVSTSGSDSGDPIDGSSPDSAPAAETSSTSRWVFADYDRIMTTQLTLLASPKVASYNGWTDIFGSLNGPSSTNTTVSVYATPYGGSEQYVGTYKCDYNPESLIDELFGSSNSPSTSLMNGIAFHAPIDGPIDRTTTYRVHYAGSDFYSACDASVTVYAKAGISLSASAKTVAARKKVTLKAAVYPVATVGGSLVFEYNDYGTHWKKIATKTLALVNGRATASTAYAVPKGTHKVRARFLGSASNYASTSASLSIRGK